MTDLNGSKTKQRLIAAFSALFPIIFYLLFLIVFGSPASAQDLRIETDDLRLELRADGGYHLFIRKKPDIASVLLTESTRDPAMQADNYAYRAGEWNPVNGDEIRLLDGVPIPRESRIYSLISSTVVNHSELGPAFHIYIPHVLYYGYEWSRHGEVDITDGTFLNIRAFSLPYADYRGAFMDNPFRLEANQEPLPGPPEGLYTREALVAFTEITQSGSGDLIFSTGPSDLVNLIMNILEKETGNTLDLVICLDTTGSMRTYLDSIRQQLIPALRGIIGDFPAFRIGMVLYRDYHEEYLTRVIPFTSDFNQFQRSLNAAAVRGGGDIPEAVYEALYEGAVRFPWAAESRVMILIGDAPPHPQPRGNITKDMVDKETADRGITVNAILLPQ